MCKGVRKKGNSASAAAKLLLLNLAPEKEIMASSSLFMPDVQRAVRKWKIEFLSLSGEVPLKLDRIDPPPFLTPMDDPRSICAEVAD